MTGPTADPHVTADQDEVAAFLSDPATHGMDAPVQRIDTHGAMVFLAGDLAYKVKRAVNYPYMDFSTLAKRRAACEREIVLNRRTAPEIYIRAIPIMRGNDGRLRLGGSEKAGRADGHAMEWVVEMRRFDGDTLLDRLADRGALTPVLARALADKVAAFHREAEALHGADASGGGSDGLRWALEETCSELAEYRDLFAAGAVARFRADCQASLAGCAEILDTRLREGLVRRCHGDLHLGNLCLVDGHPTIFDAIEFNDALSNIDVLYDLAFLLMDISFRGLGPIANVVLNRYHQFAPRYDGLRALPLFLASRAAIRAKVSASARASQRNDTAARDLARAARAYFRHAVTALTPAPPRIVAVGGLSGSGKSTIARMLAPEVGHAPGAIHLRSDAIRKELFGADETDRLPESAYAAEVSADVYRVLEARAAEVLRHGWSVIVDAVSTRADGRNRLRAIAEAHGARFHGLWLDAPAEVLVSRVETRTGDASDATADVVRRQIAERPDAIDWIRIDAAHPVAEVAGAARRAIGLGRSELGETGGGQPENSDALTSSG
jgi:aminoglycoside phosphotransferase family enzyme/predicted kinase